MKNRILAGLLAGAVILSSCATLKPTASYVSSPDYNQRVNVENPKFVSSRSVVSYIVDAGLPVAGGLAGYLIGGPVKTASPEGVSSMAAGNAVLGALAGAGLSYLSTQIAGYGKEKEVKDIEKWLRNAHGKDYIILSWDGRVLRVIDPAAESNYTVRNFADVEDFAKAFPGSSYANRVVEQAAPLCGEKRDGLVRLEQLFPQATNLNNARMAYLRSCNTFLMLDDFLRIYPDFREAAEPYYANAVKDASDAQVFHAKYPSSQLGPKVFRNAFSTAVCSQEDALRLYKLFGYDACLASATGNIEKEHGLRLAEGLRSIVMSDRGEADEDLRDKRLLQRAADLGLPVAQAEYGAYLLLYEGKSYLSTAVSYLEKAAEAGNTDAAEYLVMVKGDKGSAPDKRGWLKWTTFLAEKDMMEYQRLLTNYYDEQKDGQEYVKWMRRLLEGHTESDLIANFGTANLGILYWNVGIVLYEGQYNLTANQTEGERWIRKGADLGFQKAVEWCSKHGSKDDRINYLRVRAKDGDPQALYELADQLLTGGSRSNYPEAIDLLQRASDQGHAAAKLKLAYLYESGGYLSKDLPKALSLYKEAVAILEKTQTSAADILRLPRSISSVGQILYKMEKYTDCVQWFTQKGCPTSSCSYYKGLSHAALKQYPQAASCYKEAYENGYKAAGFELAYCYVYGRGVTKNLAKAQEYLTALENYYNDDDEWYEDSRVTELRGAIREARK